MLLDNDFFKPIIFSSNNGETVIASDKSTAVFFPVDVLLSKLIEILENSMLRKSGLKFFKVVSV